MHVVKDLKFIIRMNLIHINKLTNEDINLTERIFSLDVGSKKGETTRTKPKPVVNNIIEIPKEILRINYNIVVSIDILKIN